VADSGAILRTINPANRCDVAPCPCCDGKLRELGCIVLAILERVPMTLKHSPFVPAKAGIQETKFAALGPRLRGDERTSSDSTRQEYALAGC
jgi:hypothetical protein